MDLSDDELLATKNEVAAEKIISSLNQMINKFEKIIDFNDTIGYWEKEKYCYEILKKIKKGEVI